LCRGFGGGDAFQEKKGDELAEQARLLFVSMMRAKQDLDLFLPTADQALFRFESYTIAMTDTHSNGRPFSRPFPSNTLR
jgi:superfamily I DNA/RNA helicase